MKKDDCRDYIGRETEESERIMSNLSNHNKILAKAMYPEYELSDDYCTSLEPYSKIYELLPFRKKLIVHINIELPDLNKFQHWYGVFPEQLLELQKDNRIEIMINLPRVPTELPSYLDVIIERKFPTSLRLGILAENLISEEKKKMRGSRT